MDFCYKHICLYDNEDWTLRAIYAARALLPELVPDGVEAFCAVYPSVREHLGALFVTIVLLEPTAMRRFADAWVREGSALASSQSNAAEVLFRSLVETAESLDQAPHKTELEQLPWSGGPGDGPSLGLLPFGRDVGFFAEANDAEGARVLKLGLKQESVHVVQARPQQLDNLFGRMRSFAQ